MPGEYGTIQAAIDDCNDGDVVIIAEGTYTGTGNRDLDFNGKAITVRSTNPDNPTVVAVTIIDCNGSEPEPHIGFDFHTNEDANSVVAGFTITRKAYFRTINSHSESGLVSIKDMPILFMAA